MTRLIYTKNSSGKRKASKSKKLAQAREEHDKYLESMGIAKPKRRQTSSPIPFPELTPQTIPGVAPTSDKVPGGVVRTRDILYDHKWRKDAEEKAATLQAIKEKAAQIGPGYHKGGLQYLPFKPEDARKQ